LDDPAPELQSAVLSDHAVSEPKLSQLVVEEDSAVEGERWDGEVSEWNLSGSQSRVEEWNVEEDGDEGGLEEKAEVTHLVDHKLLGEGKVSGLADHEISPLDAHNRDEVAGLSVLQGLSGVADWPVVSDVRILVELWEAVFINGPSAASPGFWFSD